MTSIKVTGLYTYPIKSTAGNVLDRANFDEKGLAFDRAFAVINEDDQIITVRECQKLLKLSSQVRDEQLRIETRSGKSFALDLKGAKCSTQDVGIFSDIASAKVFDNGVNEFLSKVIVQPCRLVMVNQAHLRVIPPAYFDAYDVETHFCDLAPIHIVSEESIADLNTRLEVPVTTAHFRPNIVVSGVQPFEEDQWKAITINGVQFTAFHKTSRCVATTVNPETLEKSTKSEPLKTMASYRTVNNKVKFGIYLIPKGKGQLRVGDELIVN